MCWEGRKPGDYVAAVLWMPLRLDLGWIQSNGRMMDAAVQLQESVFLHQCDVRELQLAKGAIGAGLRILAREWGTPVEGLDPI